MSDNKQKQINVNHCCTIVCRPQTCEYGDQCPKAHSEEELQEWIKCTKEEKEIGQNIEAQGLLTYRQRLLNEYQASNNDGHIVSTIFYVLQHATILETWGLKTIQI